MLKHKETLKSQREGQKQGRESKKIQLSRKVMHGEEVLD